MTCGSDTLAKLTTIKRFFVLQEMARQVSKSEDIPDGEEKQHVVAAFMEAAIKATDLIEYLNHPSANPAATAAHTFVQTCVSLRCEHLVAFVFKTITDQLFEDPKEYYEEKDPRKDAQFFLSPLICFWTTDEAVNAHASDELQTLRGLCIDLLLERLAERMDMTTLEALLNVATKRVENVLLTPA